MTLRQVFPVVQRRHPDPCGTLRFFMGSRVNPNLNPWLYLDKTCHQASWYVNCFLSICQVSQQPEEQRREFFNVSSSLASIIQLMDSIISTSSTISMAYVKPFNRGSTRLVPLAFDFNFIPFLYCRKDSLCEGRQAPLCSIGLSSIPLGGKFHNPKTKRSNL